MAHHIEPKKHTIRQIAQRLGPWQHCWVEVQRKSGIKLISQFLNYAKTFAPWEMPKEGESFSPAYFTDIFARQLQSIAAAQDVLSLQSTLIIRNGNEFLLRDNPTRAEFEKILSDSIRWNLKPESHLSGGVEARQMVRGGMVEVIKAARTKFASFAKGGR